MTSRSLVQISLASSLVLLAGASLAVPPIEAKNVSPRSQTKLVAPSADIIPLSSNAERDLIHMREEEKVARDVYAVLGILWNAPVFSITNSEQNHMDAMKNMLDRFSLPDPVTDDTIGAFTAPEMADLYAQLLVLGSTSVVDAYKVGALVEELDLVDLRLAVSEVRDPVLIKTYENLMRATRNHLRAFAAQIYAAGETYEAQFLSQEEFDAIAASDSEPGGDGTGGGGGGNGGGNGGGG